MLIISACEIYWCALEKNTEVRMTIARKLFIEIKGNLEVQLIIYYVGHWKFRLLDLSSAKTYGAENELSGCEKTMARVGQFKIY